MSLFLDFSIRFISVCLHVRSYPVTARHAEVVHLQTAARKQILFTATRSSLFARDHFYLGRHLCGLQSYANFCYCQITEVITRIDLLFCWFQKSANNCRSKSHSIIYFSKRRGNFISLWTLHTSFPSVSYAVLSQSSKKTQKLLPSSSDDCHSWWKKSV